MPSLNYILNTGATNQSSALQADTTEAVSYIDNSQTQAALQESSATITTSPTQVTLTGYSTITTSQPFFSSSMAGGTITVVNPVITLQGAGTRGANGFVYPGSQFDETTNTYTDATRALSGSYTFAIVSVLNSTKARVSQISGFKNGEDSLGSFYAVLSTPTEAYAVNAFSATSNFTASYIRPSVTVITQNSASFADIILSNIEPATGDLYKVKTLYKPSGMFGEFTDLGDTIVEQTDVLIDENSLETNVTVGSFYENFGRFESLSEINTYWTSSGVGALNISTPLTLTYDMDTLAGGVKMTPANTVFAANDATVFNIKPLYRKTLYADTEYIVTFNVATAPNINSYTNTNTNIPNPRLDIYISGSAIETQEAFRYRSKGTIQPITDFNSTVNSTTFKDNGTLGTRIGTYQVTPTNDIISSITFRFKALETKTFDLKFVTRRGHFIIGDIQVLANQETGFSPNYVRIFKRIPTEHLNTPLTFKFQYFDTLGKKALVESIAYGAIFDGDNTYINGTNNLITGSVYIGNAIGSGVEMAGVNSAYIRSIGYQGFISASVAGKGGQPGFMIWSGSVLPGSGDNYSGVGIELVTDADNYFRYRTNPSELDVHTEKFFLGSTSQYVSGANGNIAISSSNFYLDAAGNVTMQGTITAQAGTIGGFAITSTAISSSNNSLILRGDTGIITGSNVLFTGGKIASFTLSNDAFTAGSTFFISSSANTANPSGSFFISSSRFNVRQDGTVTGSNVLFDGGRIAGFTISNNTLSNSTNFFISGSATGNQLFISSSRFNVKASGDVTGSQVLFTGGKIGSFVLTNDALSGIRSDNQATSFYISSSVDVFSPDGVAFFISSSRFNVRQDGTVSGSNVFFNGGRVGGFSIDSTKITGENIIINSAGSLQTADYASNLAGWKISAVDNGFAEFENVRVRGTLKTAVFEKETVNAVGGQLYVANSSTITGSEALTSIPQLVYLKFGGYSGSNAIQNIAGSGNTYVRIASLVTASIANLPTSTQTFKPIGGTGLLIESGSKAASSATNTDIAQLAGLTTTISASYTVMAWVRPNFSAYTSTTPTGSILEKSGSGGVSTTGPFFIGFKVDATNTGSVIYSSGNEVSLGGFVQSGSLATGSLRSNQWTHIALTGAGSGANYRRILYINGVAQAAVDTGAWPNTNTSPINIGVGRSYSERFPGYIADVRVYTGSLSAAQIQTIYSGSYFTGSIEASTPAIQIDNVTGFINGEILSAKKVDNTGFATEYFQVRDTMRLNPSSDTDFSGVLYVTRSYGNGTTGDSGSLGGMPQEAQSYSPSQVIVSTGKIGTGFIRINANPNDQTTPYIDIVERTGSGIYDVKLKARLGDLSGLADSTYVFGNSNPGFGLATDNVFLQGGIIANTGSIGGIKMQSSKLFTGNGTFNDNNTGFYLDATSQFSLGNKLSWNGSSLNIVGDITVTNTEDFASLRDKSTYVTALIATASTYVSFNSHTNAIFTRHGYPSALTTTVTSSNTLSDISASYDLYVIDYANFNANSKAQLILDLFDAGYSVFSTGNDTSTSNTTGSAGSEWPIIASVVKGINGNFTSSSLATGIGGISPNDPISFGWTSFYTASEGDSGNLPTKLKTDMNGASTCVPLAVSSSTQADAVPESNTTAAYVAFYATNPRGGRWVHTNARILSAGLNPSASIKLLDFLYRRDSAQEAYHDGFTKITGNMIQTGKIQSTNWTTGGSVGSEFNLNNGTFKLGGDVNPEFSWDGTNLRVSGSSTELLTPSFLLGGSNQYISGSGGLLRISSSNFHLDTAGNVTMTGTVTAQAGTIGGFNITSTQLSASGFLLNSSVGEFELGATAFSTGNGIYMSKAGTDNFRVGNVTAARMQFTGTNLEIYNSSNAKLVSLGASNTIASFAVGSSQINDTGNNLILKSNGQITGSQVLFSAGRIGGTTITSTTLTGGILQTSANSAATRIVIDGSGTTGTLKFYKTGTEIMSLETQFTVPGRPAKLTTKLTAASSCPAAIGTTTLQYGGLRLYDDSRIVSADLNNKMVLAANNFDLLASANTTDVITMDVLRQSDCQNTEPGASTFTSRFTYLNRRVGDNGNYNRVAIYAECTNKYENDLGTYYAIYSEALTENLSKKAYSFYGVNGEMYNADAVGIGTTTMTYKLNVQGDINAIGFVRANGTALTSDLRLKSNIINISNGISIIKQLRPVAYNKKNTIDSTEYTPDYGFIAQELQSVLPDVVTEGLDADKILSINYTAIIPILTKAIQEQQQIIEQLTERIQALEVK